MARDFTAANRSSNLLNGEIRLWTATVKQYGRDVFYWYLLRDLLAQALRTSGAKMSGKLSIGRLRLCREFGLTTTSLVKLLDKLEAKGLISGYKYHFDQKVYDIYVAGKDKLLKSCDEPGFAAIVTIHEIRQDGIRAVAAKVIAQSLQVQGEKAARYTANKTDRYAALSTEVDFLFTTQEDFELTRQHIQAIHCLSAEGSGQKPQAVIAYIESKKILVLAEGTNYGSVSQAKVAQHLGVSPAAVSKYLAKTKSYRVAYWSSGVEMRASYGSPNEVFASFSRPDGSKWTVKLCNNVYLGLQYRLTATGLICADQSRVAGQKQAVKSGRE